MTAFMSGCLRSSFNVTSSSSPAGTRQSRISSAVAWIFFRGGLSLMFWTSSDAGRSRYTALLPSLPGKSCIFRNVLIKFCRRADSMQRILITGLLPQ